MWTSIIIIAAILGFLFIYAVGIEAQKFARNLNRSTEIENYRKIEKR